jgi:hypothetical protein
MLAWVDRFGGHLMTLTEEQREAIRVISKLPMAIGCQLCHPYIMENYGSHFIVLRDMIDSSGTVEPTGGFDLEAARAADEALPYPLDVNEIWVSGKGQMLINPPNAPSIFFTLFRSMRVSQSLSWAGCRNRAAAGRESGITGGGVRPRWNQSKSSVYYCGSGPRISDLEIEITGLKADLEQSEEISD